MAAPTAREVHLATALELFDELGPAFGSDIFPVQKVATLAGVSRSTIYRNWASARDLHDDLLRWEVMERTGWQRRILLEPHGASTEASLTAALRDVTSEFAIVIRGAMCGFMTVAVGRDVVAWERRWLDSFGHWMHEHLRAHDRQPAPGCDAFGIALAVACIIEGALLLAVLREGAVPAEWSIDDTKVVAATAAGLVELLSRPGQAATGPAAPPLPGVAEVTDAQRLILDRLLRPATGLHAAKRIEPEPARMVDFRLLSERADVSERRLYAIWPTVNAFNGDLVELIYQRQQREAEEVMADVLLRGLEDPDAHPSEVTIAAIDALTASAFTEGRATLFSCMLAMMVNETRQRGADAIAAAAAANEVALLARVGSIGREPRPPIDGSRYLWLVFGATAGAQRMGVAHPDLRALQTRWITGSVVSALSIGLAGVEWVGTQPRGTARRSSGGAGR